MKRISFTFALVIVALLASPMITWATTEPQCGEGTGLLRISPHGSYYPSPIVLSSPATFNITATNHATGHDPIIILTMTNASYQGLTGDVTVQWIGGTISFPKASWTSVHANSAHVPPNGTTTGARYAVSSLKDHIGVEGSPDDTLWYAYGPFLSRPVNQTAQDFTITLPSTHPRMLVYALAKCRFGYSALCHNPCDDLYNMKVPPTQPDFVVPDLAPALMMIAPFSALGLIALKRKKT